MLDKFCFSVITVFYDELAFVLGGHLVVVDYMSRGFVENSKVRFHKFLRFRYLMETQ